MPRLIHQDMVTSWQKKMIVAQRCLGGSDEDDGLQLLADLSLCTYLGCLDEEETTVPKVVSVSSDDDCHDSISDIGEERHCSVKPKKAFASSPLSVRSRPEPFTTRPTRISRRSASTPLPRIIKMRPESPRLIKTQSPSTASNNHYQRPRRSTNPFDDSPPRQRPSPEQVKRTRSRYQDHPIKNTPPSDILLVIYQQKKSSKQRKKKSSPDYPAIIHTHRSFDDRCAYV